MAATQIIRVDLQNDAWAQLNFGSPSIPIQNGSSLEPLLWTLAPSTPALNAPVFTLMPGKMITVTQPDPADILWVRCTRSSGGILITSGSLIQVSPTIIIDAFGIVIVDASGNALV